MMSEYNEYCDECIRKYTAEYDRIQNEYNEKLETEVSSKKAEYIKMKEQVANYRIVVPHKYKELIAELSSK